VITSTPLYREGSTTCLTHHLHQTSQAHHSVSETHHQTGIQAGATTGIPRSTATGEQTQVHSQALGLHHGTQTQPLGQVSAQTSITGTPHSTVSTTGTTQTQVGTTSRQIAGTTTQVHSQAHGLQHGTGTLHSTDSTTGTTQTQVGTTAGTKLQTGTQKATSNQLHSTVSHHSQAHSTQTLTAGSIQTSITDSKAHKQPNPSTPNRSHSKQPKGCFFHAVIDPDLPSIMQLRFLGTGTSAGIPVIACSCQTCTSTDQRDKRTRTSATVEFTDPTGVQRVILIDTSPDLREQALREDINRVDAILFTHNHVDHTFGLDEVRRFNEVMKEPINIYANQHTMDALSRVYQHIFEPHKNIQKSFIASLVPNVIEPNSTFELFGLSVTPITLNHGKLPILGFIFENPNIESDFLPLAYCTDVSDIPDKTLEQLAPTKTLVLDALRHKPHPTHFTVEQAVGAASQINPSRTYLVHMTHDLMHTQTNADLPNGVALSYDGLIIS